MRLTLVSTAACAVGLAMLGLAGAGTAQPGPANRAAVPAKPAGGASVLNATSPRAIPNQFIVVLADEGGQRPASGIRVNSVAIARREAAIAAARELGGKVGFTYNTALVGFSVILPNAAAVERLRAMPGVAWIEADLRIELDSVQTQHNPPAGLDRTSERLLPLNQEYTYSLTGAGVHAYIVDTGILGSHQQFAPRIQAGFTAINDGQGTTDCNGHGTHVAGTVGGTDYGIAKAVTLHPVRVLGCTGSGSTAGVVAGVDWVTQNAVHPAVANLSLGGPASPTLDAAVTNSIASGITYAVAAGNSFPTNACNVSPARVPTAITVGAANPTNDTVANFSNVGPCIDLFGPGVNILSSWIGGNTASNTISGTSMATPHVAGVAAMILELYPTATPATVLNWIHYADNVVGTVGWPGLVALTAGSPNELLHYGSKPGSNGFLDGDPHVTTVDGVSYDFQGAGEYTFLRGPGLEMQVRDTAVATAWTPGPNGYTGIGSCVSLNTALAVKVAGRRVTFQPNINGRPDPSGMQLRVDGALTPVGSGINLGSDGRVAPSAGGGIQIHSPDGAVITATPGWWASEQHWYLNISVHNTTARDGIMGAIAPGSWLPALPDGTTVGAKPAAVHQRWVKLYQTFGAAWRVRNANSLFDYKPGDSTANFTLSSWPPENPAACNLPASTRRPAKPIPQRRAEQLCAVIENRQARANCAFDVMATGDAGFARTYRVSEKVRAEVAARLGGEMTIQPVK